LQQEFEVPHTRYSHAHAHSSCMHFLYTLSVRVEIQAPARPIRYKARPVGLDFKTKIFFLHSRGSILRLTWKWTTVRDLEISQLRGFRPARRVSHVVGWWRSCVRDKQSMRTKIARKLWPARRKKIILHAISGSRRGTLLWGVSTEHHP
jgi:hypothetical protein